jgi:hypothetical protein
MLASLAMRTQAALCGSQAGLLRLPRAVRPGSCLEVWSLFDPMHLRAAAMQCTRDRVCYAQLSCTADACALQQREKGSTAYMLRPPTNFWRPRFDCMQALCLSQLSSRQPIPQDALLLRHKASSNSGSKRSSSVAAAAARHSAATAVAAFEERIEEKELHVEASEAYLAVSDSCNRPANKTAWSTYDRWHAAQQQLGVLRLCSVV